METEKVTNIKAGWLYLLPKELKLYKTAKRRYFVFSKLEGRTTTLLRLYYYKDLVAYKQRDVPKGVINISDAQYIGIGLEKMGKYSHLITVELPGKEMHLSASCCEDRFHWCVVLRAYRFNDQSRMASSHRILPNSRSVQDLGQMYRADSSRTIRSDPPYTIREQATAEYWNSNLNEDSKVTKDEISDEIIRKRLVYCKECMKKTSTIKDNMDSFTNYVLPSHDVEAESEVDEHDYEEILEFIPNLKISTGIGSCKLDSESDSLHSAAKFLDERYTNNVYVPGYKYPVNPDNSQSSDKIQITIQSPASSITEDLMKTRQPTSLSKSDIRSSPQSTPDDGSYVICRSAINFSVSNDPVRCSTPIHKEGQFKNLIPTVKAGDWNTRTFSEDRVTMGSTDEQESPSSTYSKPPRAERITPLSILSEQPKQRIQRAPNNVSTSTENSSPPFLSKGGDLDPSSVKSSTNKGKARVGLFRNLVAVSVVADV